jgi:hypothetical protein
MIDWKTMESAPKDRLILLYQTHTKMMWFGEYRYGRLREPNQDTIAWRSDCSGTYTTPTHWAEKPKAPKEQE